MPEGTLLGTEGALKFILKFIFQLAEGKPALDWSVLIFPHISGRVQRTF